MQLALTEGEQSLRDEVRAFLDTNLGTDELPADYDERMDYLRAWQRRLNEAKLVGLSWPVEFGGRGATVMEKIVAGQEMARAGAPEIVGSIGLEVVGPSIIEFGTNEQKERFVAPILSGDELWCQGFSEPEAGSDLASLRTHAEDLGDHFLLNGQKIWTSYAQYARWCAVLARTDRDASPHKGISYLIVGLRSPGVTVSPLALSTGDAEFGEVFFEDVKVPKDNLLGALNGGWGIAMHTLAHERGPYAMARQTILSVLLDRLLREAERIPRDGLTAIDVPEIRHGLAQVKISLEVLKHQCYRSIGTALANGSPGFESSVDKVLLGRAEQQLAQIALDVLGPYASLADETWSELFGVNPGQWHHTYLYGRAGSVYGGSAQIQKNIIAERILGLPRSS